MVMTAACLRTALFSLCFFGCLGLSVGHTSPYFTPARKKPTTRKAAKTKAKVVKTKKTTAVKKTTAKKGNSAGGNSEIPKSLRAAIKHCIKLIKEKKYRDFLTLYTTPEDLKKFRDVMDKVVAGFGKVHAPQVQKSLEFTLRTKPTIQRNVVTFKVPSPNGGNFPARMRFEQRGSRWYLLDN